MKIRVCVISFPCSALFFQCLLGMWSLSVAQGTFNCTLLNEWLPNTVLVIGSQICPDHLFSWSPVVECLQTNVDGWSETVQELVVRLGWLVFGTRSKEQQGNTELHLYANEDMDLWAFLTSCDDGVCVGVCDSAARRFLSSKTGWVYRVWMKSRRTQYIYNTNVLKDACVASFTCQVRVTETGRF